MTNLGLGVMISALGGNRKTVDALRRSVGKAIRAIKMSNDVLVIRMQDGSVLNIMDDGQSCCESRYMTTDDTLDAFNGSILMDVEIADGSSNVNDNDYCHEVQFLKIKTSFGVFTMETHNEHNGYYGGFSIQARLYEEVPE